MIQNLNCTFSGGTIRGVLRIPDNLTTDEPIIIMCHGFNSNYHYFDYIADKLLDNGIATYCFDFCGGGECVESGGSIFESSVLTQIKDLSSVISIVKNLDYVAADEIYLLGHSQGGLVASLAATENNICGLFLLAPAYNIPEEMARLNAPKEGQLLSHPVGYMSRKYVLDARKIRIYDDVKNFFDEVYIFHGKNDYLVPSQYSKKVMKYYSKGQLHLLENEKHTFTQNGQNYVIQQIIKKIKGE